MLEIVPENEMTVSAIIGLELACRFFRPIVGRVTTVVSGGKLAKVVKEGTVKVAVVMTGKSVVVVV